MKRKKIEILKKLSASLVVILTICTTLSAESYEIKSPDSNIILEVSITDKIEYSVNYQDKIILLPSSLSLNIDNKTFGINPKIKHVQMNYLKGVLEPVLKVKSKIIENTYFELVIEFEEPFKVIFRAYNDGVAYRFVTELDDDIQINSELVEYNFAENCPIYFPKEDSMYTHQEREYTYTNIADIEKGNFCSIPTLLETSDGPKLLITEADLIDYPGLYLQAQGNKSLKAIFPNYPIEEKSTSDRDRIVTKYAEFMAKTDGNRSFPWRTIIIAPSDGDLLLSQMVYKLSSPCEIEDTSWIKPGKVAWDWWNGFNVYGVDFRAGVNTDTYKYFIDFASKYGIEYIILDEGWYHQGNLLDTVSAVDMPELLAYGKEKNVGLILWTTWKTLDEQFEQAMDMFSDWGVAGLKVDFMQRDDQKMVQYYEKVAKEAAKRKLLIDFHGSYKPAGLRRRYPNVITREGVHGNEQSRWCKHITPTHTLTLPFIRMVAGPMDFTPGAMRNFHEDKYLPSGSRPGGIGTRCNQMAMYVIFESPLQMLCDSPSKYLSEQECMEFLSPVPSVWDNSIVLDAKIRNYAYMARKSGEDWYLGGMGNEEKNTAKFKLDFLDEGQKYTMTLFRDGVNADRYAEDYKKTVKTVTSEDSMTIDLAPSGGFVAILKKQ